MLFILACEEVVFVDLPDPQNQIVVEGWVSDSLENHPIRITQSLAFSSELPFTPIENARVLVESQAGEVFLYEYRGNGYYDALTPYAGTSGSEYRVRIELDTMEMQSRWDEMPVAVPIGSLDVSSFEDTDPDDSDQTITIYYPKITTLDPDDIRNFYRWIFVKNNEVLTEPEPISVQDDRLFDGNLIPNDFRDFEYDINDEMTVELVSISEQAFNYLSLLRSQITTLGTSSGTTPAIVEGNLFVVGDDSELILGFFGASAVSSSSQTVE